MKIAPSILGIDIANIQAEVNSVFNADKIHLDIMDGQFVDNISFSSQDFAPIDFPVPVEVHLMVNDPEEYFEEFMNMGVQGIIFHIENTGIKHAKALLGTLRENGISAGLALDAFSDPNLITDDLLPFCDQILLMTVKAGQGGQKFIMPVLDKAEILTSRGFQGEIQVDGGVTEEVLPAIADAGAHSAVVGTALMSLPSAERATAIASWQEY